MSPAPAPERRIPERREPVRDDLSRNPVRAGPGPEEIPANMARQGVTGHNVRYVLVVGIAAVVIAFIIAFLFVVGRPG